MDVNTLKLKVDHGSDKYEIYIDSEPDEVPTVEQLIDEVAKVTGVPPKNQKLIFKGKSIKHDDIQPLSELGLRNNSRLMLIGKKFKIEEDPNYGAIMKVESDMGKISHRYEGLLGQVSGIERGFLHQELEEQGIKKLKMQIAGCGEELQRCMERLDGLQLMDSLDEIRMRRKVVIRKIQELLERIDKSQTHIRKLLENSKV